MKKKILTLVSAFALTLALPMTALAAPSPRTVYEPSAVVEESAAYDQRDVSSSDKAFEYHYVTTDFIDGVRREVSKLYQSKSRSLADQVTVLDVSRGTFNEKKQYTLNVSGVTASDSVVVLLYNPSTNVWDQVRAYTTDEGTITFNVDSKYSYFTIINDGTLTEKQLQEKASTDVATYLNGGKTNSTPFALDVDFFVAPQTGDASMALVVVAGIACLAVFALSKKKLVALN